MEYAFDVSVHNTSIHGPNKSHCSYTKGFHCSYTKDFTVATL